MEEINLVVQSRENTGRSKANSLRCQGVIPGVVYGEGKKSQAIQVDKKTFLRLLKSQKGENIVIKLSIASDDKKAKEVPVIIKEMQHNPVTDELIHIDFNQISLTKEIKVKIPIVAKGEPIGVKQDGGSLAHLLWDLEIECLPTEIPANVEVEVSSMKIADVVHIKDLKLPRGIKVLHDPDLVVLTVSPPVKEEVAEVAVEGAAVEPEVIKEKKEVPGEEGKEEKAEKKESPRKQRSLKSLKKRKNNFVAELKFIVGLGNPGKAYENSRHNFGARVVGCLAREYKLKFKRSLLFSCLIAQARIEKESVILCLPLTFMNNSGKAVKKIFLKKKIEPENLLVVLDDCHLPFGTIRIRPSGKDAGHNGLKSVLESLASEKISRLRLGIGDNAGKEDLRDFVLSSFSAAEEKSLNPIIKEAKACILSWLKDGISEAMNKFN